MAIDEILKQKRKEAGLTQEQIAVYLGVSTPAVNKWEKGVSYPDITLLAPLARVLKTDLNTLLSFQEELTDQEIGLFGNEVYQCISKDGFEKGFLLAKQKINEYPNSEKLIYNLALMLEGTLIMSGAKEEKKKYEEQINGFYERVSKSTNVEIRNSALFMLASKSIASSDFEKAQMIIDELPMHNAMDKRTLQAHLCTKRGETVRALEIYERMLLGDSTNAWNLMISILDIEIEQKNGARAAKIARLCSEYAIALELPEYYQVIPLMLEAAFREDVDDTLYQVKRVIESSAQVAHFKDSILFHNIPFKEGTNQMSAILSGILAEVKESPMFAFIREKEEFQKLIEG